VSTVLCASDLRLPALRDDLQLLEGPADSEGVPSWTVFDPIRNRYFRIGWIPFQLLSRWSAGRASLLLQKVEAETTCRVERSDVTELLRFLLANNLTREPASGGIEAYLAQAKAARRRWSSWAVHHYLFFRIPLVRPERFLRRTLRWVEPLFATRSLLLVAGLGLFGLYLSARQWDAFQTTFLHFFSWQGILLYALAQSAVKVLHELGHAYTGRQRLLIGAAGVLTELGVAAIATFAWSFLPEGPLRSAAFVVATTSWLLTLTVNLNPCMRFDGYYMLSDWWGMENLQSRGFALARWRLREWLFDYGEEPPFATSPLQQRRLVVYAWATWIYRFFLFLGIALLVYHFFFKALGLALFVVEIAWFLALPIAGELRVWWSRRGEALRGRRAPWLAAGLVLAVVLALVPWQTRVVIPAVFQARDRAWVFAPDPGRVAEVRVARGRVVQRGEVLLVLDSPSLRHELRLTDHRIAWLEVRARRRAASAEDRAALRIVQQQLQEASSRRAGADGWHRDRPGRGIASGALDRPGAASRAPGRRACGRDPRPRSRSRARTPGSDPGRHLLSR
jgi:putative peptide zinc metalloprotease protein